MEVKVKANTSEDDGFDGAVDLLLGIKTLRKEVINC